MTPCTVSEGFITPVHIERFNTMRRALESSPDLVWGEEILSCHHVCYALSLVFPGTQVETGEFGKGCEHSWLVLEPSEKGLSADRHARVIADMYPWAGATPFLVYSYFMTPWSRLYAASANGRQVLVDKNPLFEAQVAEFAFALSLQLLAE